MIFKKHRWLPMENCTWITCQYIFFLWELKEKLFWCIFSPIWKKKLSGARIGTGNVKSSLKAWIYVITKYMDLWLSIILYYRVINLALDTIVTLKHSNRHKLRIFSSVVIPLGGKNSSAYEYSPQFFSNNIVGQKVDKNL